ncbi:MAG TPA: undecaprenyldiphospho-muramoylpentapeptide beta-N-acetylglucosaminyltransferase, partial [Myxococcota bacterium]
FDLELIEVGGLKRVGLAKRAKTLAQLPKSLFASRSILQRFGATAVLGVGGYASGPVLVAAKTMGLPSAICEQNSVPGLTNKMLARIVDKIFVTFDASRAFFPARKTQLVGNPVRASFIEAASKPAPAVERGLVFTFGGSQGARPLNECVPKALAIVAERAKTKSSLDVRALHQAGKDDVAAVSAGYASAKVRADVTPFIDDMVSAYRKAHVVICRAGATSCAEIGALGIPAILVPFPQAADDHQSKNARDLERAGGCVVLPQSELTSERLAVEIERLLDDDTRTRIANAARAWGRIDAGAAVARAAIAGFAQSVADVGHARMAGATRAIAGRA